MPSGIKPAIFYLLLALFLSQNFVDLVSLIKLEQPEGHPEDPFACSFIQCSTIFDRSAWIVRRNSATLFFKDSLTVEIPIMEIADEIHGNYASYLFFLRLPLFANTAAGPKFLKAYYCDPADFVKPYLPYPEAKPMRVLWNYVSWDGKFSTQAETLCEN